MHWFDNLSLRNKLWASFLPLGLTALVIAGVGYYGINQINAQTQHIYANRLVPLMELSEAEDALGGIQLRVSQLSQSDDQNSDFDIGTLREEIRDLQDTFEESFGEVTTRSRRTERGEAVVARTERTWRTLRTETDRLIDRAVNDNIDSADAAEYQTLADELSAAFDDLKRHERNEASIVEQESATVYQSATFGLIVVCLLGLVVAGGMAFIVARRISTPIQQLDQAARQMADGELDTSVDLSTEDEIGRLARSFNRMSTRVQSALEEAESNRERAETLADRAEANAERQERAKEELAESVDEILDAMRRFAGGDLTVQLADADSRRGAIGRLFRGFNEAIDNVRATIAEVLRAVETAASTAAQVSASTDQLATGAEEQSAQADEVAAAMEEMTRTIVGSAQAATETAELAESNGETARENGEVVLQTVHKMQEIGDVVTSSTERVGQLSASSEKIGEIVATIDEIADQTNLLALNAAIEAARAGEHGQGFAVVADEVRQLAERTAQATGEIESMITSIQEETSEAVRAMRAGRDEVEAGIEMADRAGNAFKEIVNSTDQVNDRVSEIAAATEEQSSTTEQISRNVEAISTVSQDQAQAVTEIARVIDDLSASTANLRRLVDQFDIGHAATASPPSNDDVTLSSGDGMPTTSN